MANHLPRRTHIRPTVRVYSKQRTILVTTSIFTLIAIAIFVYVQFTGYEYATADETVTTEKMILLQPEKEFTKPISESHLMEKRPVELASFSAKINPITVDLDWRCAAENQNDYFIVERSNDQGLFNEVGTMSSTGSLEKSSVYSFTDNTPGSGLIFYRLKQVSRDGSTSYIGLEKVTRSKQNQHKPLFINDIGPKNFENFFNINYYSESEGGMSVEIFDEAGNNVFKAYTNSKKGYNTCRFIDGRMLTKNEYTVRLANTSAAYVKKIKREFVPA